MRIVAALLWLCLALDAGAQPRTYAAISLVADGLLIVGAQRSTGSNLDANIRRFLELGDPALDNGALLEVELAVKAIEPEAKVVLLSARNPKYFDLQRGSLENTEGPVAALMPELVATVKPTGATHLILLAKYRGPAELQFIQGRSGRGYLEGIGFYIDRSMHTVNPRTGEHSQGFLAPFAYFRVVLVDLATGKVLREETTKASYTIGTEATQSGHPWEAIDNTKKVAALQRLLRDEVDRLVPLILEK